MTRPFDLPRTPKEETAELARRLERGELPEIVDAELFARRNGRRLLAWHAAKGGPVGRPDLPGRQRRRDRVPPERHAKADDWQAAAGARGPGAV